MALTIARIVGPVLLGYVIGGIPFGVIIARRFYGVDITKVGSGNTGGTNVFRNLGWKAGVATAVLDVLKAVVPTLVAFWVADPVWAAPQPFWGAPRDWVAIAAGMAAVAGHSYSPYFRLRGGKGVATAGGVALALMPLGAVLLVASFALLVAVTRIVSLSSLLLATAFPLVAHFLYPDRPALTVFATAAALLVWWRHRSNIARLLKGQEPRIGRDVSVKGGEALAARPKDDASGDGEGRA